MQIFSCSYDADGVLCASDAYDAQYAAKYDLIISDMLGHFDAGFTPRTYTHVTRQMQESAAEKMGNFMAQVMKKQTASHASAANCRNIISAPFRHTLSLFVKKSKRSAKNS